MAQGKLRHDPVAISSPPSLAQHVALFDQLGQDPVGGPLRDPNRGGDVAQADSGVMSHARRLRSSSRPPATAWYVRAMNRRPRRLATVLASGVAVGLTVAAPAQAAESPRHQLVKAYAPITMLRALEHPPCDINEEQYEPTTVNVVLGNPRVSLVREPDGGKPRVVKRAPTAADIAGLGQRYHLDLPGDPLNPGCAIAYAKTFAALKAEGKAPALTYANIAREQEESALVVQYWFFYYFNQFNDLHEGDWEGMQLAFDASTAREALAAGPDQIVLFQHAGGEKADWDDAKVEKEGTHPVVYPAAGSHATFYDSAVYVENGQGGSGLGCDNTTEPLQRVDPRPVLVPSDPRPGNRFQWLTYDGHWGQKEKSYNNGPTGPNTKTQWLEPFSWMADVRSTSPQLPGGFALGPTVTGAFCSVVATVSVFINLEARSRFGTIIIALVLIMLVAVPAALTRWRPVELSPLRQQRVFGQLVRAARQLYGRHWRPLVLIGLTSIPIVAAIDGLEWLVFEVAGGDGFGNAASNAIGYVGRPIGFAVVAAAVITFVRELERGEAAGFVASYRGMLERFWRVVLGQIAASLLVLLLALTIIGIPIAIWKYVSWQFVQQEILFGDKPIPEAFRGSSRLVRGRWWRTVRVAGFLWLISVVTGPVLGFALIFTPLPLIWINVVGTVVFALLVPYVAIGRTLLYFDLAARQQEAATEPARRRRWWSRPRPSPQPG
jgi:hypothetical protein